MACTPTVRTATAVDYGTVIAVPDIAFSTGIVVYNSVVVVVVAIVVQQQE